MEDEIREALEGSVQKWQNILDGTGIDEGIENCPLCVMFFDQTCVGCPVRERTAQPYCQGTPYIDFARSNNRRLRMGTPLGPEDTHLLILAQKERDFLISLRPVED